MSDNIINKKEQKKPEEICSSEKSTLQKKRKNNIKSSGLNSNIPNQIIIYYILRLMILIQENISPKKAELTKLIKKVLRKMKK